ncbi:ABC transporter permease [Streptomyces sp. NPDC058459]|uniref:ABC transporter permease n=1 Tax=Streptomyces sp. NPDC058459 TaxID=3346508 RepID=UPI003656ABBB
MSATTPRTATGGGAARRLRALTRAELTLLARNKGVVFTALIVPLTLPVTARGALDRVELEKLGLSVGTVMLPGAVGSTFLFAVYASLVNAYAARREELVLKRLRTGELSDPEILIGTALPALGLGLAQALLLSAGCTALLHLGAPKAPHLALLGLLAGLVTSAALAALTSAFTRSAESAQVTALPVVFASILGSGMMIPTEALPARLAGICAFLPLSPAIRLVRGGWTGHLNTQEALGATAAALAWAVVAVFAARRWFRWEPRR